MKVILEMCFGRNKLLNVFFFYIDPSTLPQIYRKKLFKAIYTQHEVIRTVIFCTFSQLLTTDMFVFSLLNSCFLPFKKGKGGFLIFNTNTRVNDIYI